MRYDVEDHQCALETPENQDCAGAGARPVAVFDHAAAGDLLYPVLLLSDVRHRAGLQEFQAEEGHSVQPLGQRSRAEIHQDDPAGRLFLEGVFQYHRPESSEPGGDVSRADHTGAAAQRGGQPLVQEIGADDHLFAAFFVRGGHRGHDQRYFQFDGADQYLPRIHGDAEGAVFDLRKLVPAALHRVEPVAGHRLGFHHLPGGAFHAGHAAL